MSNMVLGAIGLAFVLTLLAIVVLRRRSRRLNVDTFTQQWKELQAFCKQKDTWPQALQEADKLLDAALRKRRFKGKTMGERMVSAQRLITNNDAMWFAHNLVRRMAEKPEARLKEQDVKAALVGFRSALKDLEALVPATQKSTEPEEAEATI